MDEYFLSKVLTTPDAVINIYRPMLTEEERAQRMKEIKRAAVDLAIANRRAGEGKRQAADPMSYRNCTDGNP